MSQPARIAAHLLTAFILATVCLTTFASAGVTEEVLYTFGTPPAGAFPLTKPLYLNGKFYGTTSSGGGGCNCGTIYEFTPSASGGIYKTIYTFKNAGDGVVPLGNIVADTSGNIYGVTGSGGAASVGTVWELSPGTGGTWNHTDIWDFGELENDGSGPDAGLIIDGAGNLYGTTDSGGTSFAGTVFELSPGSNGQWNESILHSFSGPDGYGPKAELIMDAKGDLYGTTMSGGTDSDGVVFKMSPVSGGGWSETVIYNFTGGGDQGFPEAPVWMDSKGNLYGTTIGTENNVLFGTVYELLRNTGGTWTESTLHTFTGDDGDGAVPAGGVTFDGKAHLYGTTSEGGTDFAGTVYQLNWQTGNTWGYDVYYTFPSGSKGGNPSTGLTLAGGKWFGATTGGPDNGDTGAQVLYEINP
jgi:uncharacterized repeat protein (TIGR03803 family)